MLQSKKINYSYEGLNCYSYRYGFQGQEKDGELSGEGNSLNYKYRMHDPRIGRFFATDPLEKKYPFNSPYAFSENRVLDSKELEGCEDMNIHVWELQNNDGSMQYINIPSYETGSLGHGENGIAIYFHGADGVDKKPIYIPAVTVVNSGTVSKPVEEVVVPTEKEVSIWGPGGDGPFGFVFGHKFAEWLRGVEAKTNIALGSGDDEPEYQGVKGMYNAADGIDFVGDKLSYSRNPLFQKLGAILSGEADLLRTVADYNTMNAKDAMKNAGKRVIAFGVEFLFGKVTKKNTSEGKKYIENQAVRKTVDKVKDVNTKKPD